MKNLLNRISSISDEKKCATLLALTIFMGFLLFYTYIGDDINRNDHEGIIRLHVIANSNTVSDQRLKLQVRDAVIAYMDDQDELDTVGKTREHLKNNLDRLETIANGVIAAEGYEYDAKAELGVRFIPEKTYGDMTFPAGNYEALNITLGEGEGENWWCVVFPPLCLLEETTLTDEELAELTENEALAELTEDDVLTSSTDARRLQLRWKLPELLKQ